MVAVNINEQAAMGQLAGPSFRDILILNRHYQCPPGYGGKFCGTIQTPSIDRCSRKMIATKTPRRMRVRINENQFAKGARTCIFHIVVGEGKAYLTLTLPEINPEFHAPYNARVQLIVDQVSGNCVPGCWREAAEFKVRHNKQTTGNRSVLLPSDQAEEGAVQLANSSVYTKSFERTPARDGDGTDDEVEIDDDEYVFDKPQSEVDDEFEIDVQEALPLGTPPNADDLLEVPFHDGSSSEENPADYEEEMTKTLQELPPLDDDLELMVDDNDVVELEKPARKTP
ncbi:unnamed protein product [Nippostrongylus brasiliensis]|uniref:Peptidase M12A domain-containing protein n=1 Tax=Nippostrongylus brasiliensis TaxID=27835 RepID=A0A0N4Y0G7_NIPBR|nr:unnamed protein product [Nippostrongylus brasiliensis]